ncbi:hypothetical protein [Mycobacterium sp. AZCC_0083]|nr:hypothetical protein [Mycobacterium sp. AZCC_0083]MBB5167179.1 23S rRNA maturation mini-RNase III [Mycobacterium sp. AZCC_0083]
MSGVMVAYDGDADLFVYRVFVPDYQERFGYLHDGTLQTGRD